MSQTESPTITLDFISYAWNLPKGVANKDETEWQGRSWRAQKDKLLGGIGVAFASVLVAAMVGGSLYMLTTGKSPLLSASTVYKVAGIGGGIGVIIGLIKAYRYKHGEMTPEMVSIIRQFVMDKNAYRMNWALFTMDVDNWVAYGMVSEELADEIKLFKRLSEWLCAPYIKDKDALVQVEQELIQTWDSMSAKFGDSSHLAVPREEQAVLQEKDPLI